MEPRSRRSTVAFDGRRHRHEGTGHRHLVGWDADRLRAVRRWTADHPRRSGGPLPRAQLVRWPRAAALTGADRLRVRPSRTGPEHGHAPVRSGSRGRGSRGAHRGGGWVGAHLRVLLGCPSRPARGRPRPPGREGRRARAAAPGRRCSAAQPLDERNWQSSCEKDAMAMRSSISTAASACQPSSSPGCGRPRSGRGWSRSPTPWSTTA